MGKYSGSTTVTFGLTTALSEVITQTDLGVMVGPITEASILETVNTVNNITLTEEDVTTEINMEIVGATITAVEGGQYSGSVDVTFTEQLSIDDVLQIKDLGYIETNDAATILEKINDVNNLSLTEEDVVITSITETSAVVAATE